jgi:hypothetical protein
MNYDYSNTPEDKSILVELMNKRVSENPDFDLIIVDKYTD